MCKYITIHGKKFYRQLTKDQFWYLFSNESLKRHGLARAFSHWPRGEVPVEITATIPKMLQEKTLTAMK